MSYLTDLLQQVTQGSVPALNSSPNIQAQKVNPVPYAMPPAAMMGSAMNQAYAMAGPTPQNPSPPPIMSGVPGRVNPPMIPRGSQLPMRNPTDLLRLLGGRLY